MAKAVFTTKVTPSYDDLPEKRYHFPRTYLRAVEATVGDSIVYYEPRRSNSDDNSRGGQQAYFATADVTGITSDTQLPDHYYAHVVGFISFPQSVAFRKDESYRESALQRSDGRTNKGAFGRSVRLLPEDEFSTILGLGFSEGLESASQPDIPTGFSEQPMPFERPIVEQLTSRPFRDAAFRRFVRTAYDNRCAITGLRLINGEGRPEVEAAHIVPVSDKGDDSVRNGLALSGTVHWMFDRGLISISNDYRLLAPKSLVPEELKSLVTNGLQINLPANEKHWPHPTFLGFHRNQKFRG